MKTFQIVALSTGLWLSRLYRDGVPHYSFSEPGLLEFARRIEQETIKRCENLYRELRAFESSDGLKDYNEGYIDGLADYRSAICELKNVDIDAKMG
jgi:hypothetical protein